ncbi:Putative carboxylesterase, type B, carboxylesterase type B, active, alpha/Beta hydrolase [Septoria linicola]|uniref:Carboxylic ester hydrolase n=1 Tax=Septoria linicola TaxID=215465 RepID=A0A9Q9EMJ5_9PEZI|nr:putative carboxylesterase, type B, carboxylesterase type B, active, alpha/Beta hydrolase [Septoria linicola]USW54513.1 Putative carboxylesterase, type B, carboxylesterase type B, active, alpha/Beta hydrolase [Septoria linicola]
MFKALLLPLLSAAVLAAPLDERQAGPSVTISNGTLIGSSSQGVDSFKGIPFAQPPVGDLRLRAPRPLTQGFGTRQATQSGRACPQFMTNVNTGVLPADALGRLLNTPFLQRAQNAGEDCLTIDVQRPSTATASSKLPVLFWVYGGGFEFGSNGQYDGSSIVRKSISLKEPVIYVAVNYRVSGFGFLGGNDLAAEGGNTNLGLRDQRLGLQWVQDNIAKFGGDPAKVTIWGESAGAISVLDQTIINGGDNTYNGKPLFRAAIMNSGSIIPAAPVTGVKSNAVYNTVVQQAGCSSAANRLACLRALPYEAFLNAVNSVPSIFSYQSVDLAYLPRPDSSDNFFAQSPEIAVNTNRFARVPIIVGDQEDEGTLFSLVQVNVTTNADVTTYVSDYFRPNNPNAVRDTQDLLSNYPNQPLIGQPGGSPFNTGPLNSITPQFKRLAAVLGDITFTLTRRVYLSTIQPKGIKTWTYLSSYLYGTPVLGTFHASDIIFSFGLLGDQNPITNSIQTYYLSFVNHLDPNAAKGSQIQWPEWTPSSRSMLNLEAASNKIIKDDFREAASQDLLRSQSEFII